MARPAIAMSPAIPSLIVDGFTHFVARTPPLRDAAGNAVTDRMLHLAICASPTGDAIHGALAGIAQYVGNGVFTRAFLARDLERHLLLFAGRRVWLVPRCPGLPLPDPQVYCVVLARDAVIPGVVR